MVAQIKVEEAAGESWMRMGDGVLLVASKSEPGVWHRLDHQGCDCKGYRFRGFCRHLKAAMELEAEQVPQSDPVHIEETRPGGPWIVIWGGFVHGGHHFRIEDAQAHADELRKDPGFKDWAELHTPAPVPLVPSGRPALTLVQGVAR